MNTTLHAAAAAMIALAASPAAAQIMKGVQAPKFDFEKTWNDAPASFDKLRGKLVIVDFSQTW